MKKITFEGTEDCRITATQERNLRKLAARLNELPANYPHFDMQNYLRQPATDVICARFEFDHHLVNGAAKKVHTCGTVACAIGHGPALGIRPKREETWIEYAVRVFGLDNEAFSFAFSGNWATGDNTPRGAAQRITLLLETLDVPVGWKNMMYGNDPLYYAKTVVPRLKTLGIG